MDALNERIRQQEKTLAELSPKDPGRATSLNNLGSLLARRFKKTQNREDLNRAIDSTKQAVEITPAGDPKLALRWKNLSMNLVLRFYSPSPYKGFRVAQDRGKDLEEAFASAQQAIDAATTAEEQAELKHRQDIVVQILEQAIQEKPRGHPDQLTYMASLSLVFAKLYEQKGQLEDFHRAIDIAEDALKRNEQSHESILKKLHADTSIGTIATSWEKDLVARYQARKVAHLHTIGRLFEYRFDRTGEMSYLDRAIHNARQAIEVCNVDDESAGLWQHDLSHRQHDLSITLQKRYERSREIADLHEAVDCAQAAVECARERYDAFYCSSVYNLSVALFTRFERLFEIDDLDRSILASREAREALQRSESNTNIIKVWNGLAVSLRRRYEETGRTEDLEEAIKTAKHAVSITPRESPLRVTVLSTLSQVLKGLFQRMGRLDALEITLLLVEESVASSGQDAGQTRHLVDLASRSLSVCKETNATGELRNALENTKRAVDTSPKIAQLERSFMLTMLADIYDARWKRLRGVEDLDEAIHLQEEAITTSRKGHVSAKNQLTQLAGYLIDRYTHFGREADLEECIRVRQRAQEMMVSKVVPSSTVPALADGSFELRELSDTFSSRYLETKDPDDLEKAIRFMEKATSIMPRNHSQLPGALMMVSTLLGELFDETMNINHLHRAIETGKEALAATHSDAIARAMCLVVVASHLRRRFKELHSPRDLNEAIETIKLAEPLVPEDDTFRALYLSELGSSLCLSPEEQHREQAVDVFMQAYRNTSSRPLDRLSIASKTMRLLEKQGKISLASKVAGEAVRLMVLLVNRTLSVNDQRNLLSKYSTFPIVACSLLLKSGGGAGEAVQLLEMGRGIILGYLIGERSDVSELAAAYPEQARRYDRLRTEISATMNQASFDPEEQRLLARRQLVLVRQLEAYIEDIRRLPGQGRFLLGPTERQMQKHLEGTSSAIVIVNVTLYGSDAIIISASGVESLSLPGLSAVEVAGWTIVLGPAPIRSREEYGKRNRQYRMLLLVLWTHCVKPVLDRLGCKPKSSVEELPRIWWIGTGVASMLPFHAAGDHAKGSTENTLSWAISSYTPTIKALAFSREREESAMRVSNPDALKLLIVTMPTTPGETALPGTTLEKTHIQSAVESRFWIQSLTQPSAEKVLQRMRESDVVHFACHGVSDMYDPSKSHLLLQKDDKLDPLTIKHLLENKEARARIVYLNACSTAVDNSEVFDEGIHLASCFQAVGIPHVIGSLWPTSDAVNVEVAQSFYNHLGEWKGSKESSVSVALHRAVLRVRECRRRQPIAWAGYIHLGC